MQRDAADAIRLTTLYLLPRMEAFLLARKAFIAHQTKATADHLFHALREMSDMANAATTDVACARIAAVKEEPFILPPADTMPRFLDHGKGTAAHAKGLDGNLPYNCATQSTAQELYGILRDGRTA